MAQTQKENSRSQNKATLDSSPLVEVIRIFQAPVDHVWRAWSDAEMVKQWWGPETFTAPFAKMDFREGGKYLFAMKSPEGQTTWTTGIYERIIPNEKIVYSDQFSDKNGKPITAREAGMDFDMPFTCYVTLDFEQISDDETRMHLTHEGIPAAMHDDCVNGWSTSFDKLQKLVEKN